MRKEDFEISKMSYVSRDFASIYPEVLQIAESLTDKWTPTQSNESDPGVVLLKEGAFLADHLNYNIDKNILENFLPSATQDRSVRDICEMNGYTPRYYVSATGEVKVRYRGKDNAGGSNNIVIPKFTLVISNDDESISYTQATDLTLVGDDPSDLVGTCMFIQGTLQSLSINNTGVITLSNLDDYNRLYLPEFMVAQNGIYITSADNTREEWVRDNYLLTKPSGSKVYKIDYDSYNGLPYIEFPSDIASLIGNGLYVRYIATLGEAGNVNSGALVNILSPTQFTYEGVTLSMEDFVCSNAYGFMNGKNPETINQMYNSFMHTVGTFDTLVTCLDYSNYIYNIEDDFGNNIVSNDYVTDRRTDYNKALNVISNDLNGEYFENISLQSSALRYVGCGVELPQKAGNVGDLFFLITNKQNTQEKGILYMYDIMGWKDASTINIKDFTYITSSMTPYDLSIYALKAFSLMDYNPYVPQQALEASFKPVSDNTLREIKSYVAESKNICHTYRDPKSTDIFMFKNYAPLRVSIITYSKVTKAERDEILNNIYLELSKNFNPRNIEFGDELDREQLKKTIINADARIKDITLDFDYYMRAMTTNGLEYSLDYKLFADSSILVDMIAKNILAGRVCLFDFEDRFRFAYGQSDGNIYNNVTSIKTEVAIPVNTDLSTAESNTFQWVNSIIIDSQRDTEYQYKYYLYVPSESPGTEKSSGVLHELGDAGTGNILSVQKLKGKDVVQTYEFTSTGDAYYRFSVTGSSLQTSTSKIYSDLQNCTLTIERVQGYAGTDSGAQNLNYTLKANESIQIIHPNYYSTETYGTYVLYRYAPQNVGETIPKIYANQECTLKAPIKFKYTKDGVTVNETFDVGTTIMSTFDIVETDTASGTVIKDGEKYASLSSNQTISKREMMTTIIDNTNLMCYWIIKSSPTGENLLFEGGSTEKILGDSDYFIYADESLNEIIILGAGTKLNRDADDNRNWLLTSNNYSIESISNNGINSDIPWRKMSFNKHNLVVTEMSIISLGEGDKVNIYGWDFAEDGYVDSEGNVQSVSINNEWKTCSANIKYSMFGSSDEVILPKIPNYYKIRSRLDLAMSADYPQELIYSRVGFSGEVTQKITVTTSSGTSTISSELLNRDDKKFIQCSQPLVATGGDYVDLSIYEMNGLDLHMYAYKEVASNQPKVKSGNSWKDFSSDVISIPSDRGLPEHIFPFWFRNISEKTYPDSTDAYIIPVYVENEALEVCVYATGAGYDGYGRDSEGNYCDDDYLIELEDFNGEPLTPAAVNTELTGHYKYFLTGSKKYFLVMKGIVRNNGTHEGEGVGDPEVLNTQNVYFHVRWSPKYNSVTPFKSANPSCVIVDEPVVVNGLNKKLSKTISTGFAENKLLQRMKNILDGSDDPHLKPNYIYEPDSSMVIDVDRYVTTDPMTGEYQSLAFDNPMIMFDNNNVVHDMTIAEVDIANSNIDVSRNMRNY